MVAALPAATAHRNLEAAERAAELAGLVASVVGEIPLGARVGQVGAGVVLGRLGRRVADEDDVAALAQPGHEVAATGPLGERGRGAGSGRFRRAGPAATASGDDSWDSRAVRGISPSMHVWFKTAERIGQRFW
jgi:hypothetical protein